MVHKNKFNSIPELMKNFFALIISTLIISTATAQLMNNNVMLSGEQGLNWYVSNSGSGSNDGHDPALPIDVATLLTKVISDNDNIFFNRGETFEIGDYDLTDDDVTISAYGSGDDPILTGGEDISGLSWTHAGGGIYTASVAVEPKWIWIDDVCAKNAETARVTVSSRGSATTATVPNGTLDAYTSIVGAYVVIKEKVFQQSIRLTITNFDKTTDVMTFTGGGSPTTGNVDLVVYNDDEFLTGNNEWAWVSGTLYVKAAASPSTLNIKKSDYTYGIKTTGDGTTVSDIEFEKYYTAAIWTEGDQLPVHILDCYFHDIRDVAVLIEKGCASSSVIDNVFERIGNNGVLTRASTDFVVTGNTFTDIGMQSNYGWQTWSTGPLTINSQDWYSTVIGTAFAYEVDFDNDVLDGSNLLFDQNVITNVAYCGLNMGVGTDNTVTRNIVTTICGRFTDGGGLYFFHYRAYNVPNENNEIANNIVTGNTNFAHAIFGIYMDNRTRASNIHHNTVYSIYTSGTVNSSNNFSGGIFLNVDTETHTLEDNQIFDCSVGIVIENSDDPTLLYDNNTNNIVNDNTIATGFAGQYLMLFDDRLHTPSSWNPYGGTGGADNNAYAGNITPVRFFNEDKSPDERTFAQHQADYGEDASSVLRTNVSDIEVNATNATSNEDATSDYIDLFSGSTLTTYTIDPYYSKVIGRLNYSNTLTAASSQYFNAGTTGDIQFTNASNFAISFWFKFVSNPAATQFIISNQNAGTSRGYGVAMTTSGTFVVNLINTVSTNRVQYTTAVDVADNTWHHFLFNYPGTPANGKIYIDGVDVGSVAANNLTLTIASSDNLLIGALNGPSNYMNGLIDEVAIWDSSMASNVANLYNNRAQDYNRRLSFLPLHYWHMGKTASLLDVGSSATDLNLTAVNSPTNSTDTAQ